MKNEFGDSIDLNIHTNDSPEALKYLIEASKVFFLVRDYHMAIELYQKAAEIDSNYCIAFAGMAYAYGNLGLYEDAKKMAQKAYELKDGFSK